MDDLAGLLVTAGTADTGAGILGHVFGDQQARVETAIGRTTGVDAAMVGKIMAMVAPLVLGYLGRQRRQESLDATGIVSLLTQERQIAEQRSPQAVDMLSRLLDSDDDGTIVDDIAQMGASALGSLFKVE